ncbi:Variant surface glycoprotein [Trypanosoma congolense IL3000]|uniref:Variant surface glycoprotein n=1 Tax=Trypanosoma congolense (strain IL3000) TaxID=1068625 RepID=F9W4D5_TRYCI|nr:Variant surface glycoprotein [Trypanosoma congolense IL3000]
MTMIMKILKVMKEVVVVMVMMLIGVQAHETKLLKKDDFAMLCDVVKATTSLWDTVDSLDDLSDTKVGNTLGVIINEIFFGEKWSNGDSGYWALPEKFEGSNPVRSEVCSSDSVHNLIPSASESLAWTFLCLCTPKSTGENNLCGFRVENGGTWSEQNSRENVRELFLGVWGEHNISGVMKNCVDIDIGSNLENAKKNSKKNSQNSKPHNNRNSIVVRNDVTCKETYACVKVKKNPTWLEKLKKIKTLNLTRLQKRPKSIPPPVPASSQPIAETESPHKQAPASSQIQKELPHKNTPKAPLLTLQQEPEKKPEGIPPKPEEDPPVPKSETGGSLITLHNWPLWASLLM